MRSTLTIIAARCCWNRFITFTFALGALLGNALIAADNTSSKPNIIYFLVDDQAYADVGFNGCTDIKTPNIDKLAKDGAILHSFYGQPVCSSTRAALMTGRYPTHTGIYNVCNPMGKDLRGPLPLTERTLAESLREAGYTTAICGKWHLGSDSPEYRPTKRGFEYQYGFWGAALDSFTHIYGKHPEDKDWYRNDQPSDDQGYTTHLIAQEACRLIKEQAADKPLFLYVATNAVHGPVMSPDEYMIPYEQLDTRRKEMAGMSAALDEAIGKIVAALEEKGLINNTLIIYSSDNGGVSWGGSKSKEGGVGKNRPLRGGKSDIYDGGIRLCSFVSWPGTINPDTHIKEPIHIVDWYPTLCKLAGASTEQKTAVDGLDVWPVITQGAKSPHDAILLMGSRPGQRAIRMGDYKLLLNPAEFNMEAKCAAIELYHIAEDIGETKNLAEAEPVRVKAMMARLDSMTANAVFRDKQFKLEDPSKAKEEK